MNYNKDLENFINECTDTINQLGDSNSPRKKDYIVDTLYNYAYNYDVLDGFKEMLKEVGYPEYSNIYYVVYVKNRNKYIRNDDPDQNYNETPFCNNIRLAIRYECSNVADYAVINMDLGKYTDGGYDVLAVDENSNILHIVEDGVN